MLKLDAIRTRREGRVLFATLDAPPLNLIGPAIVNDLVTLVQHLETDGNDISVVVFDSTSPDFFSAHVDMTAVPALREKLARLGTGSGLGTLYLRISSLKQVTIASIAGRVRGAGSEFVLACDMRFASRERALFGQPENGVGAIPGAGAVQHLTRLMGRGRALEVLLGADDFTADLAERYGWVNRALPDAALSAFVEALAHRIGRFPAEGLADTKRQVNAISLPSIEALNEDSRLFLQGVSRPQTQARLKALFAEGLQQAAGDAEMQFGGVLGRLG
jgi:enoyl-CoA hydratase/carnithine racemase